MTELNKKNPLVSVVIPCYNHQDYIKECIQSIINQDYNNIELLIIDDGSTDKSAKVIKEMSDICRERFIRFEFISRANIGLCNTLNQALSWCEGEYFSAVASDDVWLPFKIKKQVKYLETHLEVVAVFGGIVLIDEDSKTIRKIQKSGSFEFKDILLNKYFLPTPTALIRSAELKAIGYDPTIKVEDWNMWLKISKPNKVKLVSLKDIFAKYRQHQDNMSGNAEMMHTEGLKILAQFSDDVDYKQAIAEHELAISATLALKNKQKAIHHFITYLKTHKYSSRALPVLIKIIIPRIMLNKIYQINNA
jgi:alpha-1,3-rhamnosyltransferase